MDHTYEERLQALREKVARQRQLAARLESLRREYGRLADREAELAKARAAEQADVDRLESGSLAAYFFRLTGSLEDRLDQERAEAYQAAVRHDAVCREKAAVEADMEAVAAELRSLSNCEEQYRAAMAEKAAALKAAGAPIGNRLLELEEQLTGLAGQGRELREAIEAGEQALGTADDILRSLSSAEGWGTWDLLGGGFLTDLAKHSHLDDAQRKVESLQMQLCRFRTELADVTVQADLQVQIDGFLGFADYFFDGLFADWAVLDRIHSSQSQAQTTRDQIWSVLAQLEDMVTAAARQEEALRQEYDRLTAQA
jgi:DNA repair exonuclease SbcCD ATPase subunit